MCENESVLYTRTYECVHSIDMNREDIIINRSGFFAMAANSLVIVGFVRGLDLDRESLACHTIDCCACPDDG